MFGNSEEILRKRQKNFKSEDSEEIFLTFWKKELPTSAII